MACWSSVDGAAGLWLDAQSGYDATISGATYHRLPHGPALTFDGASDYATAGGATVSFSSGCGVLVQLTLPPLAKRRLGPVIAPLVRFAWPSRSGALSAPKSLVDKMVGPVLSCVALSSRRSCDPPFRIIHVSRE